MATDLARRIEVLRNSSAYKNYLDVKEVVLGMLGSSTNADGDPNRPSEYWREELAGFEYMLDASPLIVDQLRHHTFHVTGLRVYDYRTHKDDARTQFMKKLDMLDALGYQGLKVPESPTLGGFGHEIDGALYNVDTLKYYEVLIALKLGGVVGEFSKVGARRLVWEIGSGWGGFAYQFKTLFPNTTYVMIDLPELFIFSAVYLKTLFPSAKILFVRSAADADLAATWQDYDFVFVPHTRLSDLIFPRLDLTINMVSFQEMTTEQVRRYVVKASEQQSLFVYSLNRDRSLYNRELTSVREIIAERFWPRQVEVLDLQYTQMPSTKKPKAALDAVKSALKQSVKPDLAYKHVIGWRKVDA